MSTNQTLKSFINVTTTCVSIAFHNNAHLVIDKLQQQQNVDTVYQKWYLSGQIICLYTKASKSADFGTKENTADCEIRRYRGLLCIVHGTKAIYKVHILQQKGHQFHEILGKTITNLQFQSLMWIDFTKINYKSTIRNPHFHQTFYYEQQNHSLIWQKNPQIIEFLPQIARPWTKVPTADYRGPQIVSLQIARFQCTWASGRRDCENSKSDLLGNQNDTGPFCTSKSFDLLPLQLTLNHLANQNGKPSL